jgi:hypothetical protein
MVIRHCVKRLCDGVLECPEGQGKCIGDDNNIVCTDLQSSIYDCGQCNFGCAPGEYCEFGNCVDYGSSNIINLFTCQFAGGAVGENGEWIRMSIGFEEGSLDGQQEAAEEAFPYVSFVVTLDGELLEPQMPLTVEYNDGAGFWEINEYFFLEDLAPGTHSLLGKTYNQLEGGYIDTATCSLIVS